MELVKDRRAEVLASEAYDEGYRKAFSIINWGFRIPVESYDDYGSGAVGIANVLRQELAIPVLYEGDNYVVDENGRVYPYAQDIDKIAIVEDALKNVIEPRTPEKVYPIHWKVNKPLMKLVAKIEAVTLHPILSNIDDIDEDDLREIMTTYASILDRILAVLGEAALEHEPLVFYELNRIFDISMQNMLNDDVAGALKTIDENAKQYIIEKTKARNPKMKSILGKIAAVLTLAEALMGSPWLARNPDKLKAFNEHYRDNLLGAALQLAHMAAVYSILSEESVLDSKDDLERYINNLELLGAGVAEGNILATFLKEFGESFFDTAEKLYLNDAIVSDDYDSMHIAIEGGRLYVKTGGAGGHYAYVTVKGLNDVEVEYSDHDSERVEALVSLLKKLPEAKILHNDTSHLVFEWHGTPRDLGALLASLASVDIKNHYDLFRRAHSIDELVKLRLGHGAEEYEE